jgi:hypothetical protein
MNKEPNIYSFYDECYVYYGDYKQLQERIDKAIEYIEKHSFFVEETGYNKKIGYPIETYNAQEILDILKVVR